MSMQIQAQSSATSNGAIILQACQKAQFSFEYDTSGGVYSQALFRAMLEAVPGLTFEKALASVHREVSSVVERRTVFRQTPQAQYVGSASPLDHFKDTLRQIRTVVVIVPSYSGSEALPAARASAQYFLTQIMMKVMHPECRYRFVIEGRLEVPVSPAVDLSKLVTFAQPTQTNAWNAIEKAAASRKNYMIILMGHGKVGSDGDEYLYFAGETDEDRRLKGTYLGALPSRSKCFKSIQINDSCFSGGAPDIQEVLPLVPRAVSTREAKSLSQVRMDLIHEVTGLALGERCVSREIDYDLKLSTVDAQRNVVMNLTAQQTGDVSKMTLETHPCDDPDSTGATVVTDPRASPLASLKVTASDKPTAPVGPLNPTAQDQPSTAQDNPSTAQDESSTAQVESSTAQVEPSTAQDESSTAQVEPSTAPVEGLKPRNVKATVDFTLVVIGSFMAHFLAIVWSVWQASLGLAEYLAGAQALAVFRIPLYIGFVSMLVSGLVAFVFYLRYFLTTAKAVSPVLVTVMLGGGLQYLLGQDFVREWVSRETGSHVLILISVASIVTMLVSIGVNWRQNTRAQMVMSTLIGTAELSSELVKLTLLLAQMYFIGGENHVQEMLVNATGVERYVAYNPLGVNKTTGAPTCVFYPISGGRMVIKEEASYSAMNDTYALTCRLDVFKLIVNNFSAGDPEALHKWRIGNDTYNLRAIGHYRAAVLKNMGLAGSWAYTGSLESDQAIINRLGQRSFQMDRCADRGTCFQAPDMRSAANPSKFEEYMKPLMEPFQGFVNGASSVFEKVWELAYPKRA